MYKQMSVQSKFKFYMVLIDIIPQQMSIKKICQHNLLQISERTI